MARSRTHYTCTECGADFPRWSGRCPNCNEWDTLQEHAPAAAAAPGSALQYTGPAPPATPLHEISVSSTPRMNTGLDELDRVLGGGVLPGAAVLLGGEPGAGKSTILLQALDGLSRSGFSCLYVTCEESLSQVRMRAERLGLGDSALAVSCEPDLAGILALMESSGARVVAVDSVQRVRVPSGGAVPGGVRQVTTSAGALTDAAKRSGCAVFLAGHVTKDGVLAGPRALEHLVDTVLYFESERFQSLRVLRATKNRFGAVDEIGVFEMRQDGLHGVPNPSSILLAERDPSASGSVVTSSLEGRRALLVEVQALVGPGAYATPERKVSGLDHRRLGMMLCVIERQAGLNLRRCDAFVNVAGGIRVVEPAADLPMALALAGSFLTRAFPSDAVAVGEVGLGGEIRAVGRIQERLREAVKMGFKRAVVARGNVEAAEQTGMEVIPARHLRDALTVLNPPSD
jgi:DNA repair protein RadA/Sms